MLSKASCKTTNQQPVSLSKSSQVAAWRRGHDEGDGDGEGDLNGEGEKEGRRIVGTEIWWVGEGREGDLVGDLEER